MNVRLFGKCIISISLILFTASCGNSHLPSYDNTAPTSEVTSLATPNITTTPTPIVTEYISDQGDSFSDNLAQSDETILPAQEKDYIYYNSTSMNESQKRWWIDIIDENTANCHDGIGATWNRQSIMRASSGMMYFTSSYEDLASLIEMTDECDNSEFVLVNVNEDYNDLTVMRAQFSLMGMEHFNKASVLYSGNITLTGLLKIYQEDDDIGICKRGDMFFYPYPQSINKAPLLFPQSQPIILLDDENSIYMYADTVKLYLGNIETKEISTRLETIQPLEIENVKWDVNNDLADMFADRIDETEYYEAELVVSDLFLLKYDEIMTGSPFSVAKVNQVISLNEKVFEMID